MNDLLDCQLIQWPDDQAAYTAAINENPANAGTSFGTRRKRSIVHYSKLWANGRTLKVAFMVSPDSDHKNRIIAAARQWLPYIQPEV